MTTELRDTTTKGLMFVRPIPQGSAPPDPKAFWTDEYGWLVPDTTIQTITDAPKCEHDRIDPHYPNIMDGKHVLAVSCEGAPELRALLSALDKENNDDS